MQNEINTESVFASAVIQKETLSEFFQREINELGDLKQTTKQTCLLPWLAAQDGLHQKVS